MKYEKPEVVAQNSSSGSFAAGCPTNENNIDAFNCKKCERTQ
ncbi:hypothetical protein [Treponema denticola]|nr:hypothetical protein [Treponema denticola]EMB42700.1 hypothetical protein HMPREF9722_00496 [Treponema denticola ATCC 33520]